MQPRSECGKINQVVFVESAEFSACLKNMEDAYMSYTTVSHQGPCRYSGFTFEEVRFDSTQKSIVDGTLLTPELWHSHRSTSWSF